MMGTLGYWVEYWVVGAVMWLAGPVLLLGWAAWMMWRTGEVERDMHGDL